LLIYGRSAWRIAMIAFDIQHYDSVGSTNDEAMRLAHSGAAHGTVVCAREQTEGRGRQVRRWYSPAGNLHASILLRTDLPLGRIPQLSFVAALAVADAADAFLPGDVRAELKWPNDVLVRGAKVAGILIESADGTAIIGIGMNIAHAPSDAPYPITTLSSSAAKTLEPGAVLQVLLKAFGHRFADWRDQGFATVRTDWLARAHPAGSPLRLTVGDRSIQGRFADLGHDGALVIETADGLERFVAGEVLVPPTP
jgi:BirA family transcriptional regulator, biotin operon repressor / biotin---[acetyl-CoA-carboxylase] ligase